MNLLRRLRYWLRARRNQADVAEEIDRLTRFANTHNAEFVQWLGKLDAWAEMEPGADAAPAVPPTPPANDGTET